MAPVAVVFTGEEAGGVVMTEVVLWQRRMLEDFARDNHDFSILTDLNQWNDWTLVLSDQSCREF